MSEARYCKDCRHFSPAPVGQSLQMLVPAFCHRLGDGAPRDDVYGHKIHPTCASERANADACGPRARYFEART